LAVDGGGELEQVRVHLLEVAPERAGVRHRYLELEQALDRVDCKVLLRRIPPVDGGFGDRCTVRHVVHRRVLEPALGKQFQRRVEDPLVQFRVARSAEPARNNCLGRALLKAGRHSPTVALGRPRRDRDPRVAGRAGYAPACVRHPD
jgi:hypothetical protein